jgi:predicted nucleotidyltransferase
MILEEAENARWVILVIYSLSEDTRWLEVMLTRSEIVDALVKSLKPLEFVHAFWEGGAIAFNRVDQWSDIDLYVVVEEEKVDEIFRKVEKALKQLSRIKQKYEVEHPKHLRLFQAFYRLVDADVFHIVDLAVLTPSSPEMYLEPKVHGNAVFHFNKEGKIVIPHLDKSRFRKKLEQRIENLCEKFSMFNIFVQKEINRENCLEALDLYHAITLATLIEALRIKENPFHHNFKTRYIHRELKIETIERLRHLSFVRNEKDLQEKYREASEWFQRVINDLKGAGVSLLE